MTFGHPSPIGGEQLLYGNRANECSLVDRFENWALDLETLYPRREVEEKQIYGVKVARLPKLGRELRFRLTAAGKKMNGAVICVSATNDPAHDL